VAVSLLILYGGGSENSSVIDEPVKVAARIRFRVRG
jgi:hypothetical protein